MRLKTGTVFFEDAALIIFVVVAFGCIRGEWKPETEMQVFVINSWHLLFSRKDDMYTVNQLQTH